MTSTATVGHPALARNANIGTVIEHVNRMKAGQINCTYPSFTLNTNSTSTTLTDPRIFATSLITPMPTNSTASAELARGTLWFSTPLKGSVVVNHSSGSTASRTFTMLIIG